MPIVIPSNLDSTHGLSKTAHGWPSTAVGLVLSMWVKFDATLLATNFRRWASDGNNQIDVLANTATSTRRFEQSAGYASGFTRTNNIMGSFVTSQWNHFAWLWTAATGLTEAYVNGNRITRSNTGTSYTAGALGTVRLFSRLGSGSCAPQGLYADVCAWSDGVAGASGATHLLAQQLAAGQSPNTMNQQGHTLGARNKFLDDLEGWTVQGGTIFVEDNEDYPPVIDYNPSTLVAPGPRSLAVIPHP
jgi:hypothetical protein